MGNKILIFWCAVAVYIIMGATSHLKHKNAVENAPIKILPSKCQEQAFASPSKQGCTEPKLQPNAQTSELFLRKVSRKSRRFYA